MLPRNALLGLVFACAVLATGAAGADEAGDASNSGGCTRPAEPTPEPKSAVDVPDYSVAAEEQPDARVTAQLAAWQEHQQALIDALGRSGDPRDWALASLFDRFRLELDEHGRRGAGETQLLERATRAAPNDVLVQWIAARSAQGNAATSTVATRAAARLRQLEPDNAAAMLDELSLAAQRKDERAIDATLARMSASTRFDEHIVDVVNAVIQAYARIPLPDVFLELAPSGEKESSRAAVTFGSAMSVAIAVGSSGYQHLVVACRATDGSSSSTRAADCAAIGHLMVAHGGTFVSNRIGYSVLRASRLFTDADVRAARVDDWVYSKEIAAISSGEGEPSAETILAYQTDWIETGSELEAMRRKLARAGIAATPPDDWVDEASPFSAERQKKDQAWADENPPSGH